MKSILLSALALGTMTAVAVAGPVPLTDTDLDGITAGKRITSDTIYLGNSSNVCEGDCKTDVPGRKTETSSRNPGNPDNTNCNNCGDTSSGPGNK